TMSRYLRPYFYCGIFSGLLLLFANHWLVPVANKTRIAFEDKYTRSPKNYGNNIHLRLDNNTLVSLERFKYSSGEGTNFALERFEGEGVHKRLAYKITADKAVSMPGIKNWRLINYKKWIIGLDSESFQKGKQMDTTLAMSPESFEVDLIIKEALNFQEIHDFMEAEKLKGAGGIEYFQVENNRRTSSAISVLIMVVMGAAIGSWKTRGGMGLNIVAALALASLYMVFLQFASSFSVNGTLPPVVGANMPNLIYLVITFFLVRHTNK
ncbi:MAG: LptF/LptG family permease, partial [Chitinophagales bacterium]